MQTKYDLSQGQKTAIGIMTGTSVDAIDISLLKTDGEHIKAMGPAKAYPFPSQLKADIIDVISHPQQAEYASLSLLTQSITKAYASATGTFLQDTQIAPKDIDVIGAHGQTVIHRPEKHFTRQLLDGALLADLLNIPVVNDFRSNDMRHGGQGAPLVPIYHQALSGHLPPSFKTVDPIAFLNLGGVGNITYIDKNTLLAFDTGPANAPINDWVSSHSTQSYDKDGLIAKQGTTHKALLTSLLANPYFSKSPPKSLDRNSFNLLGLSALPFEDGVSTLTDFAVQAVGAAVQHLPSPPSLWLVCGGGRLNKTLMQRLHKALGVPVLPVEDVGFDGDALEAQAFAFLAVRSLLNLPLTYPSTTGTKAPVTGGLYHAPK